MGRPIEWADRRRRGNQEFAIGRVQSTTPMKYGLSDRMSRSTTRITSGGASTIASEFFYHGPIGAYHLNVAMRSERVWNGRVL